MSSQSTLADDDLFGEAAAEMREEVESHLADARAELPDPDDVWETEADNVLGVLNALKSALDVNDAEEHLRQAKKTFIVGQRADAFDDPDSLEAEVEAVEELLASIEDAETLVGDLTGAMPQLRSQLQDAAEAGSDSDEDTAADDVDDEESADEGDADDA
ncbi:DUF5790 family protein [Halobellus salinisoli]|uniref:DUF5790 family protein n=1 Tax=Halobellus salinisoli TaxID=3108500 RepID=UPI00300A0D5B